MIIIDGRESALSIGNFENLEELLTTASTDEALKDRIVTDVLVNNELFSELYPHQAEDIASSELTLVEIRSVPYNAMGLDIVTELHKVIDIMSTGSRRVAQLFRQADDDEALELFQDLLEVTRDFMNMQTTLRSEFAVDNDPGFMIAVEKISALLTELTEVLENQDWILLADMLEYEFIPACEGWKAIISRLHTSIQTTR